MKKIGLVIGILTGFAVPSIYAQGTVLFNTSNVTKISTNSVPGGPPTGLTSVNAVTTYDYALFGSTTEASVGGSTAAVVGDTGSYAFNDSNWSFQGVYGINGQLAGRFSAVSPNTDSSSSLSTIPGGAPAYFTIIGWSANIGSTWSQVESYLAAPDLDGWVGESVVSGALTPGILHSGVPPTALFGTFGPFIPGFTLGAVSAGFEPEGLAVPEPSIFALVGLGGGILLALRRRKQA